MKIKKIIYTILFICSSFMWADDFDDSINFHNPNCTNCYEPIADPGGSKTYFKGGLVTLDGTNSYDPDGGDLTYLWTAPNGIVLDDATASMPTFISPDVLVDTEYQIELVVNDGDYNSDPNFVTISVVTINTSPVIDCVSELTINKNSEFTLDASTTSDATSTGTLSFEWITSDFAYEDNSNSTFTALAPNVAQDEIFTIVLNVSDGEDTSTLNISVNVIANIKPFAVPGEDLEVAAGTEFILDGSASYDSDESGDLTYSWAVNDGDCSIEGSDSQSSATFRAPSDQGTCDIVLTVNDGADDSEEYTGTQLFISEYIEPATSLGCSNAKFIEIYNPTSSAINLTDYEIWYISNGGDWGEKKLLFNKAESASSDGNAGLSGSNVDNSEDQDCSDMDDDICNISEIQSGETLIIVKSDAFLSCDDVNVENWIKWSDLNPGGDDAIGLYYSGIGIIDKIGEDGADPGSGWQVSGIDEATKNGQLIRKPGIYNANSSWDDSAGSNSEDSEWYVYEDSFQDLSRSGTHYCATCDSHVLVTITDNQSPVANAGDDFTAVAGSTIMLDASQTLDVDTDFSNLIFNWTSNNGIDLENENTSMASFQVPSNSQEGDVLSFDLSVSDGAGSSVDGIDVTVTLINDNPEAIISVQAMYYDSDFDGVLEEFDYTTEAYEGYIVQLDASESFDGTQTGTLNFNWISPENFELSDSTISNPTFFVNEYLGSNQTITFELTVSDGDDSLLGDTQFIDVDLVAKMPIIGAAVTSYNSIAEGAQVPFDASDTFDPDGDINDLEFDWSNPGGTTLLGACYGFESSAEACTEDDDCSGTDVCKTDGHIIYAVMPTSIGEDTEYTFNVEVEDSDGYESEKIDINVSVLATWPIASSGSDINVIAGSTVELKGFLSQDPQEELVSYGNWSGDTWSNDSDELKNLIAFYNNYVIEPVADYVFSWEQTSGTAVILDDASNVNPTFIAPNSIGVLDFCLTVTDGDNNTSEDDCVTISVIENLAPVSDAGSGGRVHAMSEFILDGTSSYDDTATDGLTYSWSCDNDDVQINNSDQSVASFVAPAINYGEELTLQFILSVSDGQLTNEDTVSVVVSQFSRPVSPNLYATTSNQQINLFWDNISENAIDSLTLYADFQGYRIYRSEDYGATWGPLDSLVFSNAGDTLGWRPYAIFDLSEDQDTSSCLYKNDFLNCEKSRGAEISGADPMQSWFDLGSNTGLTQTFTDTSVVDGVDYTYTITAYDRGVREDTLQYGSYGNGDEDLGGSDETWRPGAPDHIFYEIMEADSFAYYKLDYTIKQSYVDENFGKLMYVLDVPEGIDDGDAIWTVKSAWPSTNPDGYLYQGLGYRSLESLRGTSTEDNNFVTATSGYYASDITFPDDSNLDEFIAADCKAVGNGNKYYEIVNQADLTSGLIRLEVQASQGEDAFQGYAMEDACLYAYNVMKIEEPNRLPYYSPTIFENDVEILIQPEASTLFSSYCDDTDVYYESVDCDSECDEPVCVVEDNYFYNDILLSDLDGMPGVVIDDSQVPPTVIMPDYLLECYELAYLDDPNYENNWSEFFDGMRIRFDNALRLLPTDKQAALYDAYSYPDSSLVKDFFLASQQIGTGGFGGGSSNMAELELQFFNSFESKPTFNYEIEFSSSPLDTAIQKAPSSGCGADWNSAIKQTLLPFKVKNLTTGKYVKLSHTDKGIWNGISTDVPSWFSTPDDVTSHPGYGNCVWEPGELIQFVSDTVVVGDSELPTSESTFQLKLYYESDIISFATYICANGWGFSFDEFDPTSSYSSGDCIYNEGLIWYASNDVNANYGYSPGEWHDSNSDGVNDNLWDPIYLWHDYFAQNKIVLKPQKWYADGDFWITDMSMLGSPSDLTEETLSQVKVVPNPYVARSDFNESTNGNRLRFTYLPQQCKISIYTISGELVDVINHDSTFDGNEWWDLKNSSGDDVAPGLYIYVVEASNLKEIGKFVIVR